MSWRFCLILFIGVLLEWKLTQSAPAPVPAETGKPKGKGRAYEFGFSIEEQQHRHEKRDENGIVMGEFGFITADGIYHVTVYATDENGKFKIISMKNYPYGNPEKKVMIATIPLAKKPVVTPQVIKAMMPDGKSCGGCVLPKKMNLLPADVMGKKPDDQKAVFRPLSKDLNDGSSNGKANGGAAAAGKSTPTKQSKSAGSTTSGAGAYGKGSSASQKPLPKPPSTNPLIQPKFSKPETGAGATSSKIQPKSPANNGNNYQLANFLTQSTQTPSRTLTQIPGTNIPTFSSQFGQSSEVNEFVPTKQSISLTNFSNQLTNPSTYNTNITPKKSQNTLLNTAPTLSQFLPNQKGQNSVGLQNPKQSNSGSRFPSEKPNTAGRNPLSSLIPFGNSQTVYSTNSLTTRNPTYNTNTTPKTNTNNIAQIPNYPLEINNRFGFSSQENQFSPSRGGLPNTKFPNPLLTTANPFVIPTATALSSYITPSTYNPTKSFAILAYNNGKIPSQEQQGPTINTFTQNAVQQQKPFQTLSKSLPDPSSGSKQNGVPTSTSGGQFKPPQTTTATTSAAGNTVSQKPTSGQSPLQVTSAKPKSIGTNTLTQSPPTTNTLTSTRLQQNTNGAKASTTGTQSTNEQAPVAPSAQAIGKATTSSNAGGVSGASSSGNAAGSGDGGGPLYRFKYVLDYNSHREEGRIDGSKEGKYNTIDDDGIRRIIDYIANENGYQPHIKIERLPPNELPTGENKLKEYEFLWFN